MVQTMRVVLKRKNQVYDFVDNNVLSIIFSESIISEHLLKPLNERVDFHYIEGVFSLPDLDHSIPSSVPEPVTVTTIVPNPSGFDSDADSTDDDDNIDSNEDNEQLVNNTFSISSRIKDISKFVTGPIQQNMQTTNHLTLVGRRFNVECSLRGRQIQITGAAVEAAFNAFSIIQKTVIGQLNPIVIPCIHYPGQSEEYGLYFCDLLDYRYRGVVPPGMNHDETKDMCIMLPVFIDKDTNKYAKPKDLISRQQAVIEQNKPEYQIQANNQLDEIMERVANSEPSWGENREFVNNYSDGNGHIPKEKLKKAFTSHKTQPPAPVYEGGFPSLPRPTHKTKPRKQAPEVNRRRVMRIVPQKTANIPTSPKLSLIEIVRKYNYNNIQQALTIGLESVRAFKGEVRLSAKLGKVLWPAYKTNVNSTIWNIKEIMDIVVHEYKTIPKFTSMTTKNDDILEILTSPRVINDGYFNRTAIFEFHCDARNQPSNPYKPTVIHMNQGAVDVKNVVISEKSVVEVDWVNLDRKFDFQLSLTTKELLRCDVKPFTTFNKWISICPITQLMTFENVPNFLQVNRVLFKQTTRFRGCFPFIIEIVRVEEVPLQNVPNTNKITAAVGKGECWYDFQVYNVYHEGLLQQNLRLEEVGQVADWTAHDILNTESTDTITAYVKNMLLLVENIEISARCMSM